MAVNSDWRYDPFTDEVRPVEIVDEQHIVSYYDNVGRYGFYCNEAIQLTQPSSLTVKKASDSSLYEEVGRTTAPGANQFRADYDNLGYRNTAFVEMNASQIGVEILVSYRGLGTRNGVSFRLNRDFNLPGNANAEGTFTTGGNMTVGESAPADLDVSGNGVIDGTLYVGGALGVGGALNVSGSASVESDLSVLGVITGDASTGVVVDDGLTVTGEIDGVGAQITEDGVNVKAGKTVKHNGNNVYGYLDDGTPIYAKSLLSSFGVSDSVINISHGISNAYTNDKILHIYGFIKNTNDSTSAIITSFSSLSGNLVSICRYSDTNVILSRESNGSIRDVSITILYKD
jgi:hypothetical protein